MDDTATPLRLDGFLPYRAARLATALSRGLAAQYEARYRISVAEWRVLVHLTQESEISVRDIFTRVDMDRARVTRAVQRLESRDLVSKLVNESDRRLVRLALTPAGRDLAASLSHLAKSFEAQLLATLPAGSAATLLSLFDAVEAGLADSVMANPTAAGGEPPASPELISSN
ncbi:MarR family winged helix-turn-helix transcriptional regulator [Alphaproteobacteria bacterium LSUCC0719]